MKANQIPPARSPARREATPAATSSQPTPWPATEAIRVARARLPVVFQMAERSSRPPSRGEPGGQVEGGQQQVGPGEIAQRPGQRSRQQVTAKAGNDPEQPGQQAAGQRSDQRDEELVAGAAG